MPSLQVLNTESCTVSEIHGIKYLDTKVAMEQFCDSQLINGNTYRHGEKSIYKAAICSHYLFSAGILAGEGKKNYGEKFADFIRKNDLGTLIETEAVTNDAWHPDHAGKVWVWTPNYTKLLAWYTKNCRSNAALKKRLETVIKELEQNCVRYTKYVELYGEKSTYKTELDKYREKLTAAQKSLGELVE